MGVSALLLSIIAWLAVPVVSFHDPVSPVLLSAEGRLLGARTAADGQWRFPPGGRVPERFFEALVRFEDKRFYAHPGVDPLALARAARQNLRAGRVRSGGSTITMQVVRLARKNRPRTYLEKLKEAVLALRLETRRSKKDILRLFAAHAPFGGNAVGLDAASWLYFGRSPDELSWAEAAFLAVLPNDPGLSAGPAGRARLLEKRNGLLEKLRAHGALAGLECRLALAEPQPPRLRPVPRDAPHLLDTLAARTGARPPFRSFIVAELQRAVGRVAEEHGRRLADRGICNLAAVVIDNRASTVAAYVGNVGLDRGAEQGQSVDIVQSRRSTGSILKPFLYAAMLKEGGLTPATLVPDTPTRFEGFKPENFDRRFRGAVPARAALAWSLNVPAVRELRDYGIPRFENRLRQWGMTTLDRAPDDYGLTLVLGGAEGRLIEIAGLYAKLAGLALGAPGGGREVRLLRDEPEAPSRMRDLGAASAYLTLQALTAVNRPDDEGFWRNFSSSKWVAWKTGTSFGLRDAWAVGVTSNYTIGVWAGNADGEGVPGLTGLGAAAPVLFDLLGAVDGGGEIVRPRSGLKALRVCRDSGYLATDLCPAVEVQVPEESRFDRMCTFHQTVHLDESGRFRVDSRCAPVDRMRHEAWFVLPPVQEYFYRADHAEYRPLPPFRGDCGGGPAGERGTRVMSLVYPEPDMSVYVPVGLDGKIGEVVFEAVHRESGATIHWHLDEAYLASTRVFHQIGVAPEPGPHRLVLTDDQGRRLVRDFQVISPSRRGDR
ncbi:MAG TPA: penicillin-binding protein 1C [Candidatus Aminicenantes bacterium]|nr:penicillin-binding protein 1C [Candidatus Aminicenantes bacterium]HRY63709.1 penicillin-binding protein 1C [Candidatus Aminicenantes bacterium]HRZ73259.1 penicillin-binding protein 1C [Candidatus Aminicenantes bacterium]